MESRIMQVFYGNDCLPYKDSARSVHYPIVGNSFVGANNTTQIRFYVRDIGGVNNVNWVAISKLPNGKIGNQVLSSIAYDSQLGEYYVAFDLSSYYTQLKGDVYISLNGYQGGVQVEQDPETGIYTINGTPVIEATGSIKLAINYSPQLPLGQHFNVSDLQQVLGALSDKANVSTTIQAVANISLEDLSGYENGQLFYDRATEQYYIKDNSLTPPYKLVEDGTGLLGSKYVDDNFYTKSETYTKTEIDTELNKKVDKTSNVKKVYGTDSSGNQTTYDVDYAPGEDGNIVRRASGTSQIMVPLTPTANGHATSKKYVDNSISEITVDVSNKVDKTTNANKVYATDNSGNQTTISVDSGHNDYNGNIVRRDPNGQIHVPQSPDDNDNAASKKYVDDAIYFASIGDVRSVNNKTPDISGNVSLTPADLGLTDILHFAGVTTTEITDGSTTNPVTINGASYTAKKGDVVLYGNKEFVWGGSNWEELGDEGSYALKSITIYTGTGLSGGGDLSQNRTINIAEGYKLPTQLEWENITTNYLERSNVNNTLYGVNNSGEQVNVPFGSGADEIAIRDGEGQLDVPVYPTEAYHAASKEYVDNAVGSSTIASVTAETENFIQASGYPQNTQLAIPEQSQVELKEVRGNSVVKNQLCPKQTFNQTSNGISISSDGSGEWTIVVDNPTSWAQITLGTINVESKHRYLIKGQKYLGHNIGVIVYISGLSAGESDDYTVYSSDNMANTNLYLYVGEETPNGTYKVKPQVIDLAKWFNNDIPSDLRNDPTLFGKKYWQGLYIDYNEGEIVDADGSLVDVARNIWDEKYESGRFNVANGQLVDDYTRIRSYNYIRVIGNSIIYASFPTGTNIDFNYGFWDENENYISGDFLTTSGSINVPSNAKYMKFYMGSGYGTRYQYDIIISVGSNAVGYLPYTTSELRLPLLRKASRAYDYIKDGKLFRNIGTVDMGSLNWSYNGSDFRATIYDAKSISGLSSRVSNVLCKKYPAVDSYSFSDMTSPCMYLSGTTIEVKDSYYTDVDTFKAAMSGIILYYELSAPGVEDFTGPTTMPIWRNGYEEQTSLIPYSLTKNYDITLADQIITNVQVDYDQQEEINELNEESLNNKYHLGAYDTVDTSNEDYDLITRQTGYVDLGTITNWTLWSSGSQWYLYTPFSNGQEYFYGTKTKCKHAVYEAVIYRNDDFASNNRIAYSAATMVVRTDSQTTMPSGLLQYKLATPYTEKVIKNQPLNTLDQQGSQFLRDEWEKTQNLYYGLQSLSISSAIYVKALENFTLKKGTYTWNATNDASYPTLALMNGSSMVVNIEPNSPFTITSDTTFTELRLYYAGNVGTSGSCTFTNIMLNEGDHAYQYQPYNGAIVHEKDIETIFNEASIDVTDDKFIKVAGTTDNIAIPNESQVEVTDVKGNTVAKNQLNQNTSFSFSTGFTDIARASTIENHEYLIIQTYSRESQGQGTDYQTYLSGATSGTVYGMNLTPYRIVTADNSGRIKITAAAYEDFGGTVTGTCFIIDLTQWFNGNIPTDLLDEPTLFEKKYWQGGNIAYNTGELISASGEVVNTGRNLFDIYDKTTVDGTVVYPIKLVGNGYYTISANQTVYDFSIAYFDGTNWRDVHANNPKMVTSYSFEETDFVPGVQYYCLIRDTAGHYDTDFSGFDVMLNVGSSALAYEPYKESKITLPTLNKVGSVADEIKGGKKITRIGSYTFTGNESWTANGQGYLWYDTSINAKHGSWNVSGNMICQTVSVSNHSDLYNGVVTNGICIDEDGKVVIGSDTYTNIATLLTGKTIYYELATPTEEDYTDALTLALYKGGYELQTSNIPYTLTRNYDISIKDQVVTNVEVDRQQQIKIDEYCKPIYKHNVYLYGKIGGSSGTLTTRIMFDVFNNDSTPLTPQQALSSLFNFAKVSGWYLSSGSYYTVFMYLNGNLYSYKESDSGEFAISGIDYWGIEDTPQRIN